MAGQLTVLLLADQGLARWVAAVGVLAGLALVVMAFVYRRRERMS
jgi:hypothetical protein